MLAAHGLAFSYAPDTPVVRDVGLTVNAGEIVSLLGPSGCGKSTVLRLVAGLLEPQGGSIEWKDEGCRRLGFVFQEAALMPWATIAGNIRLPWQLKGGDAPDVEALLAQVDMAGYGGRYPATLSGGQRMRISIARALAATPDLLLMDEPFAALDEMLRFQMNELMLRLKAEQGFGALFVTHSLYEAAYLSDRVLVMKDGRIAGEVYPALDRSLLADEQRASQAFMDAVKTISTLMAKGEAQNG